MTGHTKHSNKSRLSLRVRLKSMFPKYPYKGGVKGFKKGKGASTTNKKARASKSKPSKKPRSTLNDNKRNKRMK
jgi:hypothetical protein